MPITEKSGELDLVQFYQICRDYIVHEDELINNRVGWFIQLHSFLIATYGIVVTSVSASFLLQMDKVVTLISPGWPQALLVTLLGAISMVGILSSRHASLSINAAHNAIMSIEQQWKTEGAKRGGLGRLPGIIGGGSGDVNLQGASLHLFLPNYMRVGWGISLLVPVALCGMIYVADARWQAIMHAEQAKTVTAVDGHTGPPKGSGAASAMAKPVAPSKHGKVPAKAP